MRNRESRPRNHPPGIPRPLGVAQGKRRDIWLFLRLGTSAALVGAFPAVCARLPHINDATEALLVILCIVAIATEWGWAEALAAAIAGAISFDYYFVGPRGFAIKAPEYGVVLAAFSITAIAAGQLTARLKRRQVEASERQQESERLDRLARALLEGGDAESSMEQLASRVQTIFEAQGVVFYDKETGKILRSGSRTEAISDQALRWMANTGYWLEDSKSPYFLIPIGHGGAWVGSMGITGVQISAALLRGIAERVGLGLARLRAIEKTAEAEVLRRTEELKSAVLDSLAHEIRNPINSAKLAVTALLAGSANTGPARQELLTIIDEELDRMDGIIDETTQVARLEANEISLRKEPQNLARLITAAVEEMEILARGRAIQVSVPEGLPSAACDKVMIGRVFKQLLSNALKYSPPNSPLTVSAEVTALGIVVSVIDRGPGVAEDERDRIFEKYYRGRAVRGGAPGTGLGLASARAIMQAHGGQIWVTSPPSGGAAFHVSLAVAEASHTVAAQ